MDYSMGLLLKFVDDFNNYRLTKNEAKNRLDATKEVCKHILNPHEHQFFSDVIDAAKVAVDSRPDVPKDRVFVPFFDGYRTFYEEQYIW